MEAAERTARQKEQAEKDKHEQMNADLKEAGTFPEPDNSLKRWRSRWLRGGW